MGSDRIYQSSHSGTDKDKNDAIFFAGRMCKNFMKNFLKDIAQECEKVNADIFVCYTPEKGKAYLEKLFRKAKE